MKSFTCSRLLKSSNQYRSHKCRYWSSANLELADKFCYLADTLSVDGDVDAAVEARIWIGWNKFRQLVPLLTMHTHKYTHTTVLRLSGLCPEQPVPEETFTHSHLSWSSLIPYLLPPPITNHGILPVQFTCLTVFFHNLSPSPLCSTSWPGTLNIILHTFLHPIIVFFATCAHTIANCFALVTWLLSNPSLFYLELYLLP